MSKKILITYGTRPFGQRIAQQLSEKLTVQLVSCEAVPDLFVKSGRVKVIPHGVNPTYAHELLKVCLDLEIDYVLPLGRSEIETLTGNAILFEEYGIQVLLPSKELLNEIFLIENPERGLEINILKEGMDFLSEQRLLDNQYSGVLALSDSGEHASLCIVSDK